MPSHVRYFLVVNSVSKGKEEGFSKPAEIVSASQNIIGK